jgi:LMBR1 domain-containing protein 1
VTIIIYIAALMSFVGWFIFSIYVGIGFIALPINCINAFKFRPRPLASSELLKQRKALRERAAELIKMCQEMGSKFVAFNEEVHSKRERRKAGKVNSQDMNRFRVLVDLLEADLEKFQMSDPQYYRKYYNPFVPYFKLVFGVIAIILTICWLIQIILFMLVNPPIYGFLNNYFFWFDTWFPLFGTISIAIFALYLLLAAAAGNAKFGTRFFLIKVHPLEPGKTLLNGLIFNVALMLLCTLPAVQFCTAAFSSYARFTDAATIFGTQFQYLRFFRYFWAYNVFLFMILIIFVLGAIYFSCVFGGGAHRGGARAQQRGGGARASEQSSRSSGPSPPPTTPARNTPPARPRSLCPSDRDYLNKVMEEIKAKNKKMLANVGNAIDKQAGSLEMTDIKKAVKQR